MLEFVPSALRRWASSPGGVRVARATGWAHREGRLLDTAALASAAASAGDLGSGGRSFLQGLSGQFAIVSVGSGDAWVAADSIRSIPLCIRTSLDRAFVSDDFWRVQDPGDAPDGDSLIEFGTAGYVTGPFTVSTSVRSLQAGEVVEFRPVPGGLAVNSSRYRTYLCTYDAPPSAGDLVSELETVLSGTFDRLLETVRGRQVVVPLSGGLDSRLVLSMLVRRGHDRLFAFCYGRTGCRAFRLSREAAGRLGVPWKPVRYSPRLWRSVLGRPAMREYWRHASGGVSLPHCDDLPALAILLGDRVIEHDAVVVPGHTGDFICGSHLKFLLDPAWHDDPMDLESAIVRKHYSLRARLPNRPGVRAAIRRRLEFALAGVPATTLEDQARGYEYWEWQERQSKYIVNAIRAHEFLGLESRIPLWDVSHMEYWRRIPLEFRLDRYLYRTFLAAFDRHGVFPGVRPVAPWRREDRLQALRETESRPWRRVVRSSGVLETLFERYRQKRALLASYQDATAMAASFGPIRHFIRSADKRNSMATLVDVVGREFGWEDVAARRSRGGA